MKTEKNSKKELAKLYDELATLRLNLGSLLVSDRLKEKLRPQEESLKMKIIEAAGQQRLF